MICALPISIRLVRNWKINNNQVPGLERLVALQGRRRSTAIFTRQNNDD